MRKVASKHQKIQDAIELVMESPMEAFSWMLSRFPMSMRHLSGSSLTLLGKNLVLVCFLFCAFNSTYPRMSAGANIMVQACVAIEYLALEEKRELAACCILATCIYDQFFVETKHCIVYWR